MSEARLLTVIFAGRRGHAESRITATFTPMGGNSYRLDEGFLCGPVYFGDVIEADPTDQENVFTFRSRLKKAGMKRDWYVIPHNMVAKPSFAALGCKIENLGGFSALDFGGLFLVFLPKTCNLDVGSELDKIAGISKWKRRFLYWKWVLKWRVKKVNEWLLGLR